MCFQLDDKNQPGDLNIAAAAAAAALGGKGTSHDYLYNAIDHDDGCKENLAGKNELPFVSSGARLICCQNCRCQIRFPVKNVR